nr:calcium-transporting P-type ATPase, PMR1-type [Methanocella sp. CWC-04]
MELSEAIEKLKTRESGLSAEEAKKRLEQYGPNVLKSGKAKSPIIIFFSQFNNFLIYILLAATIISFFIGEILDAEIIFAIVILNAILGFVQEYKAEKAIESLRSMIVPTANVIRGGHKIRINSSELVPGDVIEIEEGENVPADVRIIESMSLKVDESALTGESEPSEKYPDVVPEKTSPGDRVNMMFMGTSALQGRCKALVADTGMKTELGKIATLVETGEETETPLQISLDRLGKFFGVAAIFICILIFIVGILTGKTYYEMFLTSVSLAVAAIPEGLPATVTIVLALGVQRMAKRKAIIRKLSAVETLGSTNIISSDKTGTLTQNIITVKQLITADHDIRVTGTGYSSEGDFLIENESIDVTSYEDVMKLLIAGILCNNATFERLEDTWNVNGDSTEVALLVAGAKSELFKEKLESVCPRTFEVPFSSRAKTMTTINLCDEKRYVYLKGAPEVVLERCKYVYKDEKFVPLDDKLKKYFLDFNYSMAMDGMRVLGFAYEEDEVVTDAENVGKNFVYLGLAGMIDPPRQEVKGAVDLCKDAGIDVVMITGDQKLTAIAIAKELDIYHEGDMAITGVELDAMSETDLEENIDKIKVYARTSPEQKLRIVEALKKKERIVAMTGDGVNDAPALKRSDIGIAMGLTGTDVSRQASDMILADDNFATIVNAMEEGRSIYDNIRKFVKFLFSSNLGEVLTVFIGILLGLPLPLLAIQILWVNLITDGLPALALSVDPADPDIMKRKPRPRSEGIITKLMVFDMLLVGAIISAGTLGIFYYYLPQGVETARSMAFTVLVVFQLWNAINCRSETKSLFQIGIFSNGYLLLAIALSIMLQLIILYVPFLEGIFATTEPGLYDILLIMAVSSTVFIGIEIRKLIMGHKSL